MFYYDHIIFLININEESNEIILKNHVIYNKLDEFMNKYIVNVNSDFIIKNEDLSINPKIYNCEEIIEYLRKIDNKFKIDIHSYDVIKNYILINLILDILTIPKPFKILFKNIVFIEKII